MDTYTSIAGIEASRIAVRVPPAGPWSCRADLVDDTILSGPVTIRIGTLELLGTVRQHGSWGMRGGVVVVGGADGWSRPVSARHYHSDAGVSTSLVVTDLARDAGETMGMIESSRQRLGRDFARLSNDIEGHPIPAARILRSIIAPSPWWVDYRGATHVGPRHASEIATPYTVISARPQDRYAQIAIDDLGAIRIGSIVRETLPRPIMVTSMAITVADGAARIAAWGTWDGSGE